MYDWMRYISFISPAETHRHPHHHPHLPDLMVHASAFKPSVGVLTPFNPSVGVLTDAMEIQELQAGFASRQARNTNKHTHKQKRTQTQTQQQQAGKHAKKSTILHRV